MGSMALNELGKMLTAAEVAEMLHLHVNTVKRLGDRGELKYYRVCKRGDRRFLLEDGGEGSASPDKPNSQTRRPFRGGASSYPLALRSAQART